MHLFPGMPMIPSCEVVHNSIASIIEANPLRPMDIPSDLIFRVEFQKNRMPRWQLYPAKTLSGSSRTIRRGRRM